MLKFDGRGQERNYLTPSRIKRGYDILNYFF